MTDDKDQRTFEDSSTLPNDASMLAAPEPVAPGASGQQSRMDGLESGESNTALKLRLTTLDNYSYDPPQPRHAPLPPYLVHCTLFASYDHQHPPDPRAFCEIGLPANHARGEASASRVTVAQSVSKLRKRLGVQVPLHSLAASHDVKVLLIHPAPRNGEQMAARTPRIGRGVRASLFSAQHRELTSVRSRPLISRALTAIYFGEGIYSRMAVFPAEAVLTYGAEERRRRKTEAASKEKSSTKLGWLKSLKPSKNDSPPDEGQDDVADPIPTGVKPLHVKVPMQLATIELLPPTARLLETKGPFPKGMNKPPSAEQSRALQALGEYDRISDQAKFERFFFTPSAAEDRFMQLTLDALERRGAIWTEAGRYTTPSSRCPDPQTRPRLLVKGFFPERFLNRCKAYRAKDCEPMPSDLSPDSVAKWGYPVIVHTAKERFGDDSQLPAYSENDTTMSKVEWDEDDLPSEGSSLTAGYGSMSGYGLDSERAKKLIGQEGDFFEGWSINPTIEPFKQGSFFEGLSSQSAMFMAGGGGF